MPRKQHVHKYELRPTTSIPVWCCALLGCNHFMPSHLTPIMKGRTSICWDCECIFPLNELNMKNNRPKCDDCSGLMDRSNQLDKLLKEID